jgi:hypothetical protein
LSIDDKSVDWLAPTRAWLYLRQARSHAFRALPELELPATFDRKRARAIARRISFAPRRKFVMQELDRTLSHTR